MPKSPKSPKLSKSPKIHKSKIHQAKYKKHHAIENEYDSSSSDDSDSSDSPEYRFKDPFLRPQVQYVMPQMELPELPTLPTKRAEPPKQQIPVIQPSQETIEPYLEMLNNLMTVIANAQKEYNNSLIRLKTNLAQPDIQNITVPEITNPPKIELDVATIRRNGQEQQYIDLAKQQIENIKNMYSKIQRSHSDMIAKIVAEAKQ